MKTLRTYLNEKGQDLVEYTLLLAFCAALLMALNSNTFNQTIRMVFEKGVFDDVSTVLGAGNAYTVAVEKWSQSSRRTLVEIKKVNGKYVLGEDVIPNSERLEADRQALNYIADFFLGMSLSQVKTDVFRNEFKEDSDFFTKERDILILSYKDNVKETEDTYDPVTQQYAVTAKTDIMTEGRKYNANEVIHWMQGDYGKYKDPTASYDSSLDFNSGKRYLYSNEMIDPDSSNVGNTVKRNIRINLTFTDGVVTGIRVRAQQNGHDVPDLTITKTQS